MSKYINKFNSVSDATSATNLFSPQVSYIGGGADKLLYLDCGDDKEVEIKEQGGEIIIQEKQTGPEYVDLGLPSGKLWMKYNLGVDPGQLSTVSDYCGKYYQFGDVVGYTGDDAEAHSDWSTCPCNGGAGDYDETYFNAHKSELLDSDNKLLPACDAVTVAYSDWHMPTKDDYVELNSNTTSTWVTDYNGISGLNGRTFAANGQTLFIPAAGGYYDGQFINLGVGGNVWSSVLYSDDPFNSFSLCFDSGYVDPEGIDDRYRAFSVRGVK